MLQEGRAALPAAGRWPSSWRSSGSWRSSRGFSTSAGAANSLHFMVGSVHKGHHLIRAGVSFVAGAGLLAGAWFAARAGVNSRH